MSKEQEHHYYAAHGMGWATAETREEAHEKLLGMTDPTWVRNCLKSGTFVTVWSCKVHEPSDAEYEIDYFQPVGVEKSDGQNHIVTHLTKKEHTLVRDPMDAVRALRASCKSLVDEWERSIEGQETGLDDTPLKDCVDMAKKAMEVAYD